MMGWLINLLKSPSAFSTQPFSYLMNQIGHAYIVGFVPAYAFGWEALPLIAAIYALWEFIQLCWFGAKLSDCIEDLGHVMAGAFAAFWLWLIIPHLVLIAAGVQWRRENA